jgi:hypothetical protein
MHRKGTSFMLRFALGTAAVLLLVASCGAQQIANDNLVMTVLLGDGSYQLLTRIGGGQMVLSAQVVAKVNRDPASIAVRLPAGSLQHIPCQHRMSASNVLDMWKSVD